MNKRVLASAATILLMLTQTLVPSVVGVAESLENQSSETSQVQVPNEANHQTPVNPGEEPALSAPGESEVPLKEATEPEEPLPEEPATETADNIIEEAEEPASAPQVRTIDAIELTTRMDASLSGSEFFPDAAGEYLSGEPMNLETYVNYTQTEEMQESYMNPVIRYYFPEERFDRISLSDWPNEGSANIKAKRLNHILDDAGTAGIEVEIELYQLSPGVNTLIPFTVKTTNYGYRDQEAITFDQTIMTEEGEELLTSTFAEATARTATSFSAISDPLPKTFDYPWENVTDNRVDDTSQAFLFTFERLVDGQHLSSIGNKGLENKTYKVTMTLPNEAYRIDNPVEMDNRGEFIPNGNEATWLFSSKEAAGISSSHIGFAPLLSFSGAEIGQTIEVSYAISFLEDDGTESARTEGSFSVLLETSEPRPGEAFYNNEITTNLYFDGRKQNTNLVLSDMPITKEYFVYTQNAFNYVNQRYDEFEVESQLHSFKHDYVDQDLDEVGADLAKVQFLIGEPTAFDEANRELLNQNILYGTTAEGVQEIITEDLPTTESENEYIDIESDAPYVAYELVFKQPVTFLNSVSNRTMMLTMMFELDNGKVDEIRKQLKENPDESVTHLRVKGSVDVDVFEETREPYNHQLGLRGTAFRYLNDPPYMNTDGVSLNPGETFLGSTFQYTHLNGFHLRSGTLDDNYTKTFKEDTYFMLLLPEGIEVQQASFPFLGNDVRDVAATKVIKNYQDTGKNALIYQMKNLELPNGAMNFGVRLYPNYHTATGDHEIESFFLWGDQDEIPEAADVLPGGYVEKAINDEFDINNNGDTTEKVYTQKASINLRSAASLNNFVLAKDRANETAPFLGSFSVMPGSQVTYQMMIDNTTTSDYSFTESFNILPHIGDHTLNH